MTTRIRPHPLGKKAEYEGYCIDHDSSSRHYPEKQAYFALKAGDYVDATATEFLPRGEPAP